jgi:hypothetical protein
VVDTVVGTRVEVVVAGTGAVSGVACMVVGMPPAAGSVVAGPAVAPVSDELVQADSTASRTIKGDGDLRLRIGGR